MTDRETHNALRAVITSLMATAPGAPDKIIAAAMTYVPNSTREAAAAVLRSIVSGAPATAVVDVGEQAFKAFVRAGEGEAPPQRGPTVALCGRRW